MCCTLTDLNLVKFDVDLIKFDVNLVKSGARAGPREIPGRPGEPLGGLGRALSCPVPA